MIFEIFFKEKINRSKTFFPWILIFHSSFYIFSEVPFALILYERKTYNCIFHLITLSSLFFRDFQKYFYTLKVFLFNHIENIFCVYRLVTKFEKMNVAFPYFFVPLMWLACASSPKGNGIYFYTINTTNEMKEESHSKNKLLQLRTSPPVK
jgi:hypothetical protein